MPGQNRSKNHAQTFPVSLQKPTRPIANCEVVEISREEASTRAETRALPLYDFEPSAEAVLDALLPRYIENVVYTSLLLAAASEHAARRRAMKSATDNADELIKNLTRLANAARQAWRVAAPCMQGSARDGMWCLVHRRQQLRDRGARQQSFAKGCW